jgi:hypothetical protein
VGQSRRGLRPQHEGEEEGGEEGAQEHEDRRCVAQSEVDLAEHHVLVDVGREGGQVPVPKYPEEIEDAEGVEEPQEKDDQE